MTKDCHTCIYKEGSCYPSLTIFDKDKTCESYRPDYEGYIADLEKENKKIFNDWLEACDRYGKVSLEQQKNKEQLERAKRIIEELHEIIEDKVEYKSTILMWNTMARAEKLLKEIEK